MIDKIEVWQSAGWPLKALGKSSFDADERSENTDMDTGKLTS
jgi:hypothetical protein